jgi:hypothetical protein
VGGVEEGWRRLHNEELHNLYISPNIMVMKSLRMRWARHIAGNNILVGEPEVKKVLGKPRRGWENNILMDLGEIWWGK